jgi:hypothetical protein
MRPHNNCNVARITLFYLRSHVRGFTTEELIPIATPEPRGRRTPRKSPTIPTTVRSPVLLLVWLTQQQIWLQPIIKVMAILLTILPRNAYAQVLEINILSASPVIRMMTLTSTSFRLEAVPTVHTGFIDMLLSTFIGMSHLLHFCYGVISPRRFIWWY